MTGLIGTCEDKKSQRARDVLCTKRVGEEWRAHFARAVNAPS